MIFNAKVQRPSVCNALDTLLVDARIAATFLPRVVARLCGAGVFVNASTRFNDGGQLGLGGETAVSTQRLHVRGPMGVREMTTSKWVVRGNYTTRA